jgi:hypothetical protein
MKTKMIQSDDSISFEPSESNKEKPPLLQTSPRMSIHLGWFYHNISTDKQIPCTGIPRWRDVKFPESSLLLSALRSSILDLVHPQTPKSHSLTGSQPRKRHSLSSRSSDLFIQIHWAVTPAELFRLFSLSAASFMNPLRL